MKPRAVATNKPCPCSKNLRAAPRGLLWPKQAQLEKAYAQYKSGEKAQAVATLDRFMSCTPAARRTTTRCISRGITNFNDNLGLFAWLSRQDSSERDQKAAKESYESFYELTQRFPNSRYAPDALQRMTYIINSLAQYEVHVARYYYQRGA